MRTIRLNSSGAAVQTWQGILAIGESGHFDSDTEDATMAWQRIRGLEPDGVVGPKTWAAAGVEPCETDDIDDDFFPRLRLIGQSLGARPLDMLSVMYSESDCTSTAWNDNPKSLPPTQRWNASGLIQFMPPTLMGLGWTAGHAAFRLLSATEQLTWVERYWRPYRGHLGTVGGLYVATFLPGSIKHAGDPNFVLTAKEGRLAWAYGPNAAFDANHDFQITVGELEAAVARRCHGSRWEELLGRLVAGDAPTDPELKNPTSEPPPAAEENAASNPTICPIRDNGKNS